MQKVLILADDLTGANDTGAAIRKHGWKTCSVIQDIGAPFSSDPYDCISVSLDSRHLEPEQAYRKLRSAFDRFGAARFAIYSKRIDSTLRGNLGPECDALLEALEEREGKENARTAMIVPAFPQAGREYYDDVLYVNGVPLAQTSVSKDPHRPILTSSAVELFESSSKYPCARVPLACIRAGADAVSGQIIGLRAAGKRNLLFEAITPEDVAVIAEAVLQSDVPFIAVDPGTFTAALVTAMYGEGEEPTGMFRETLRGTRALAVLGSCNQIAREQAALFLDKTDDYAVLDVAKLLEGEEARAEQIARAASALSGAGDVSALVLSSVIGEILPVGELAAQRGVDEAQLFAYINESIALAAREALATGRYGGVFTTGGDITVSLCAALDTSGIEVRDEIIPLAVGGKITLPDRSELLIATKGGMIGDQYATKLCVDYLNERLHFNQEREA